MVLSAIAAAVLLPLGAEGVGTTPIPPRPSGAPVLDRVGILSPAAHRTLVALESRLTSERNGAEVGVLVVDTLNGDNPRAFATDLYNAWGLGDATADNGAIIMVAKDDHAIQSIFGAVLVGTSGVAALRFRRRHRVRPCPNCAKPMVRLDETADDAKLDPRSRPKSAWAACTMTSGPVPHATAPSCSDTGSS